MKRVKKDRKYDPRRKTRRRCFHDIYGGPGGHICKGCGKRRYP